MDQLFMNLEKLTSVPGGGSFLHIVTENGDKMRTLREICLIS